MEDAIPALLMPTATATKKRAAVIAEAIEVSIAQAGWPVGKVIASEADLMARHGASRAAVREAIRIVESHGCARMMRGPAGGLRVTRPNAGSVIRSAALLLESERVTAQELYDARCLVEAMNVELAVSRIDFGGRASLEAFLRREEALLDAAAVERDEAHSLHLIIATLTGNSFLRLCTEVSIELSRSRTVETFTKRAGPTAKQRQLMREVHVAHRGIVDAIINADAKTAKRRMDRHLTALMPWIG